MLQETLPNTPMLYILKMLKFRTFFMTLRVFGKLLNGIFYIFHDFYKIARNVNTHIFVDDVKYLSLKEKKLLRILWILRSTFTLNCSTLHAAGILAAETYMLPLSRDFNILSFVPYCGMFFFLQNKQTWTK